jgi:hypothetical protein
MNTSFKSFFIKLSIFSVITFAILFLLQLSNSPYFQTKAYWMIWLFFVAITATVHIVLMRVAAKDGKKFVTTFLGITGMKLFGYLIVIIIYGLLRRETLLGFTFCFLTMYFLYTAFEVAVLYKQLRK